MFAVLAWLNDRVTSHGRQGGQPAHDLLATGSRLIGVHRSLSESPGPPLVRTTIAVRTACLAEIR
jgi:hypothetical protein